MNVFDKVYSLATENHGIVTSRGAAELGARGKDLARWVKMGRLMRVGYGVYRATQYPSSPVDVYAVAVAEMGPKAYLSGESVLAALDLAPTNPQTIHVTVCGRSRRHSVQGYQVTERFSPYEPDSLEGMPIARVADAIRECLGRMMPERLEAAVEKAYRTGKLSDEERTELLKEIRYAG